MKDFVSASTTLVVRPVNKRYMIGNILPFPYEFELGTEIEVAEEQFRYMKAGFTIDEENDVYVYPGYGAFASNMDGDIQTIEDLTRNNAYRRKQMQEEGYEYILGPAAPTGSGYIPDCHGLYCKNYLEIVEREKSKGKRKNKRLGN